MDVKITKRKKAKIEPKVAGTASVALKSDIYDVSGKKAGSIELPENIFGLKWNDALMHQVVTTMQANARNIIAHTKSRGDVRGGGRKPWQQKGTGRARHGSIRSPIWRGGGVTHGPLNEKVYAREIPKKMRAKALFIALSRKFKDGEILFVNSFGIDAPKTAVARKSLVMLSRVTGFERLANKRKNAALIAFSDMTPSASKSFRNIGSVECMNVRNLNPVAVLGSAYLVIENPEASVAIIQSRSSSKLKTPASAKASADKKN